MHSTNLPPPGCPYPAFSYGGAGAVWDVWRTEDDDVLRSYVLEHASEFTHHGKSLDKDKVKGPPCMPHLIPTTWTYAGC